VPAFRAAQIVGARFAFFVSLAHVKDRLKRGDGVFESGLGNRYFGFVWACLTLTIVVKTSSSAAAVWKTGILTMRFLKAIDQVIGFKIVGVIIV
jgi:hypothetical protein